MAPMRQPGEEERQAALDRVSRALAQKQRSVGALGVPYLVLGVNARAPEDDGELDDVVSAREHPLWWFGDADFDAFRSDLRRSDCSYLDVGGCPGVGDGFVERLCECDFDRTNGDDRGDESDSMNADGACCALSQLEALSLENTAVTDAGVRMLCHALARKHKIVGPSSGDDHCDARLRQLTLFGCRGISDDAADALVELVETNRQLEFLSLVVNGPNVSPATRERLERAIEGR
jgi:hypothetical protein